LQLDPSLKITTVIGRRSKHADKDARPRVSPPLEVNILGCIRSMSGLAASQAIAGAWGNMRLGQNIKVVHIVLFGVQQLANSFKRQFPAMDRIDHKRSRFPH